MYSSSYLINNDYGDGGIIQPPQAPSFMQQSAPLQMSQYISQHLPHHIPQHIPQHMPQHIPLQMPIQLPPLPTLSAQFVPLVPLMQNQQISYPILPQFDLNNDAKLHDMMTKYFYYKTLDKWLKKESDMLTLLSYLKINNGKVSLIDTMSQYNPKSAFDDSPKTIDAKVDFIEKHVLSREDVRNILKRYVRETSTNWYDLQDKSTYFIKEIIKKFIKEKLISAIHEKQQ